MGILDDLTEASEALRRIDQRRKDQQSYRDQLIRDARNHGISWTDIQDATGMAPRGVALAIKRTDPSSDPSQQTSP